MMSQPTPTGSGGSPPGEPRSGLPASNPLARTPWRATSTRPIYRNRWIDVREDIVALPDGQTTIYGVVECSECVGVLPFLDRDTVLLVGQYRYVAKGFFWEMPTGGQDGSETRLQAAQRELAEEAGYEAGRLVELGDFHTSKSVLREVAHLYLAEDLRPAARRADHTEFIERRAFPFAEVLAMVTRGEIKDAMTIIAVLHAARRRGM
jgi:ADP-ribose pyrophosphatase